MCSQPRPQLSPRSAVPCSPLLETQHPLPTHGDSIQIRSHRLLDAVAAEAGSAAAVQLVP